MMGLWLWLRYQMAVSKARFALLTVLTLASCAAGLLTFLSGPVPLQIINAVLSGTKSVTGFDWIPNVFLMLREPLPWLSASFLERILGYVVDL